MTTKNKISKNRYLVVFLLLKSTGSSFRGYAYSFASGGFYACHVSDMKSGDTT